MRELAGRRKLDRLDGITSLSNRLLKHADRGSAGVGRGMYYWGKDVVFPCFGNVPLPDIRLRARTAARRGKRTGLRRARSPLTKAYWM